MSATPTSVPVPVLSRSLFLRLLGLCHLSTGLASLSHSRSLYGEHGIEPMGGVDVETSFVPFFWLLGGVGRGGNNVVVVTDRILEVAALTQILLGGVLLIDAAVCHAAVPLTLYLVQTSLVNAPTPFLSNYGWEWQLAEASLLASFVCPLFERPVKRSVDYDNPPHKRLYAVSFPWLVRIAAFRVMWGAGMSKLGTNSSDCWSLKGGFSCTTTHYETQPLPNPLAYFAHRLPFRFHQFEVLFNHFTELVCPYGLVVPFCPRIRTASAVACIAYMAAIISTGTYAVINWVTVVFLVASLDEDLLGRVVPGIGHQWQSGRKLAGEKAKGAGGSGPAAAGVNGAGAGSLPSLLSTALRCAFALLVLVKTRHPIMESLSPSPWLQQFDEYHIAPAYGVFGFVNAIRLSPVIEVRGRSDNATDDGDGDGPPYTPWTELDLKCLPGRVDAMPCIPPYPGYHARLDWDVWIRTTASLEHPYSDRSRFVPPSLKLALSRLLLEENGTVDVDVRSFFRNAPPVPPHQVRVTLRRYEYTDLGTLWETGRWWERSAVEGSRGGVIMDRDVAFRVGGGRYPVPRSAIPHRHRDSALVGYVALLIGAGVASNVPSVVLAASSLYVQWRTVVTLSVWGGVLALCSVVALTKHSWLDPSRNPFLARSGGGSPRIEAPKSD